MNDFLKNMFINEAKPALNRHSGGAGGSGDEKVIYELDFSNVAEMEAINKGVVINLNDATSLLEALETHKVLGINVYSDFIEYQGETVEFNMFLNTISKTKLNMNSTEGISYTFGVGNISAQSNDYYIDSVFGFVKIEIQNGVGVITMHSDAFEIFALAYTLNKAHIVIKGA